MPLLSAKDRPQLLNSGGLFPGSHEKERPLARRGARPPGRSPEMVRRGNRARLPQRPGDASNAGSSLRGVRRLTTLMLEIKRYERQTKAMEATAAFHDVPEKKRLAVNSQNFAALYATEYKTLNFSPVGLARKKGGGKWR